VPHNDRNDEHDHDHIDYNCAQHNGSYDHYNDNHDA
jgi:hypothetical protein